MRRIYLEAEKSAEKTMLIAGVGEFKPSLVLEEAGPLPPDGSTLRHDGTDESRQEIDGAVQIVQDGPGDLAWKDGEDVVHTERQLERMGLRAGGEGAPSEP